MLYPVLYLVYMVSGLRQGLAVCLFLGIALPFLMERKWVAYVVTILITFSFHRVALAWLVLIPAAYLSVSAMMVLTGLSAVGGLLLQIGPVERLLADLIPVYHVQKLLLEGEVSWFAVGERLAAAAVLTILYLWTRKHVDKIRPETEVLWKTYLCGVCAYLLLCSSSYYASRYGAIFKVVECALVVDLAMGQEKIQKAVAIFFFCLTCLHMNRKTSPMLVQAEEPEYWYVGNLLEGGRDEKLAETVKERFSGEPVSSVFLTGTDFNTRDYKKSRDEICFRRRVFLAEQICARGACMLAQAGKDRVPYLFLSEQTLLYNVGIRSRRGGKESIYTLAEAGQSWYDIQVSQEMILVGSPVLELVFQPMLGGPEIQGGIRLQNLPERPEGTGRLLVEISFSSPKQCEVKVTDLGFGELYPASGLYWVDSFLLEEEEENHGTGGDLQEQTGEDTISGGTDRQKPV